MVFDVEVHKKAAGPRITLGMKRVRSDIPGLIDDEVEAGRVVRELHFVLTKIDERSEFVDNLLDVALAYGGERFRKTIELLDGKGAYPAEEIVSGVVLATAAAENLLPHDEARSVALGVMPKADMDYLENLHVRFGTPDMMNNITARLNAMAKDDIRRFLDEIREKANNPVESLYRILKYQR